MPDSELFAAAADGTLLDEQVLREQTQRMLADPKATALVDNFAGQWLQIRAVDDVFPDVWYFPTWDDPRVAMKEELTRLATHITNKRSVYAGTTDLRRNRSQRTTRSTLRPRTQSNDTWQTVS